MFFYIILAIILSGVFGSSSLHLYSSKRCPYAERSSILIEELGIEATHTEIDLRNKPGWLKQVSPKGKIPALTVVVNGKNNTLYESLVINEFLAESYPNPNLLPSSPLGRANMRLAVDYLDSTVNPAFFTYFGNKVNEKDPELKEAFLAALDGIEEMLEQGDYICGDYLTLADINYLPFFERMVVALEHFKGFTMDAGRHGKVCAWMDRVFSRPSFKACEMGRDYIIETYKLFSEMDYKFGGLNKSK